MAQADRHVIPRNDLVGHSPTPKCVCAPEQFRVKSGWAYFHNPYRLDTEGLKYNVIRAKERSVAAAK